MNTKKNEDAAQGNPDGFSVEEKAAMKERAAEVKTSKRKPKTKADGDTVVREKIAEMDEPDRSLALRVHEIITQAAPELEIKTWYGMPAYAKDGKVVMFFQNAGKFKARYSTLGFNDSANLDDGAMWPTSFAIIEMNDQVAEKINELVKKSIS